MCSNAVVKVSIGSENPAQMCLAQDNDVIQTLAPDRSDQPLGKTILPGRSWCGRLVPDTHGTQSACDDGAIDAIPVPDHVALSPVPCAVDPAQLSAAQSDDDKGIEQVKTDSWNNEEVHGGDLWGMIAQEGEPSLGWRPASLGHVLGDG